MPTIYDTHTLLRVIEEKVQTPKTYLLDKFFPDTVTFDTETVDLDIISKGARLAPFVHEDAPGRPVTTGGYITKQFKPAPIKMNDAINPGKAMKRRAGERYSGVVSPADRLEALTVEKVAEQRKAWLRRLEWMAAVILRDGKIDIEAEDIGRITLDLGRAQEHTIVLPTAQKWGAADVKPLKNLREWQSRVQNASGVAPTTVTFGPSAWDILADDADFQKKLDIRRAAGGQIELGPIDVSAGRYVGSIGDLDFFVYQQTYEDDDGKAAKFLDDYDVIMTSQAIEGMRAFGAVPTETSIIPVDIYQHVYTTNNPPRRFAYSESRAIVTMGRPNASLRAKVGG